MARVGEEGVVLHHCKVPSHDHVPAAGGGYKQIALPGSLVHGHHAHPLHAGLKCLDGVDLGDDDVCAHALGPHSHTPAAVAVARDHNGLARHQQIGGVHDGVPHALSGAVLVIVVVLALGVVHVHHGEGEKPCLRSGLEPMDAGGGFLGAADDPVTQMGVVAGEQLKQIAAVVDDQMRMAAQSGDQKIAVLLGVHAVLGVGLHAQRGQTRRHVVLRRQRVAAGCMHLRAGGL